MVEITTVILRPVEGVLKLSTEVIKTNKKSHTSIMSVSLNFPSVSMNVFTLFAITYKWFQLMNLKLARVIIILNTKCMQILMLPAFTISDDGLQFFN